MKFKVFVPARAHSRMEKRHMNAGNKILIGFAFLVGIVILFGAIGTASQDKPRHEADICTSGYDALDTDTRFECAKKKHLNAMTGGHPKAVVALRRHLEFPRFSARRIGLSGTISSPAKSRE